MQNGHLNSIQYILFLITCYHTRGTYNNVSYSLKEGCYTQIEDKSLHCVRASINIMKVLDIIVLLKILHSVNLLEIKTCTS